jgi:transcriptional regulator with XRE-family HTH domain
MGKKTRISARGNEVKTRRLSLGYTQREFARIIGVTQAQLSHIESGASGASEETAMAIANKLRCDFDKVFDVVAPYNADEGPIPPQEDRDPLAVSHEQPLFAKV